MLWSLLASPRPLAISGHSIGLLLLALAMGLVLVYLPLPWAVVVVVGAAVALLILIQPLFGLGLALLAGPFGALERIALPGYFVDSGQIFLLLALVAWIGRGLLRRRVVLPYTPLNLPLVLFIFVAALSLLDTISYVLGLRELLKWIEIALVMWMVVDLGTERGVGESAFAQPRPEKPCPVRPSSFVSGRVWLVVAMLLLASLVQALIGMWQFGFRGDGPEHFAILGRFFRAYGTFEQPNPFGGYMGLNASLALGILLGLMVALAINWRNEQLGRPVDWKPLFASLRPGRIVGSSAGDWLWFLFIGFCAVATSLALVLSWSRGAWLGMAAALAVLVLFCSRRPWPGILLFGGAASLFLLAQTLQLLPAAVTGRLSNFVQDLRFGDVRGVAIHELNYAVLERLAHWQSALYMARDNLWLGIGFGNYEAAYADYALINWPYALGHAHNYYLNILAETGVIGTGAYLIFWAAVFGQTIRVLSRLDWPHRGIALGLLASWAALTVHHLVDKLYVNNIYIHLGVMLGLLQILDEKNVKLDYTRRRPFWR